MQPDDVPGSTTVADSVISRPVAVPQLSLIHI